MPGPGSHPTHRFGSSPGPVFKPELRQNHVDVLQSSGGTVQRAQVLSALRLQHHRIEPLRREFELLEQPVERGCGVVIRQASGSRRRAGDH